ncbi:hypothetical protein, partial [Endozoicomonas numazuensis]
SDLNTRMPPGNDVTQRDDTKPAFGDNLFDHVFTGGRMDQASPFLMKRPVRTRMQGVVGAGG